ncbi:hypothetical protein JJB07_03365, partial [Tumebacillus sp. ITR2]|nr:hypothetical protein [Tumebacillus amylolyticus]
VDNAGNKETAHSFEVKLDRTAPTTTATAPTDWSKDDVTVALTATDAQSGVAKTYYSVNGSDFVEGTSVALTQEGVNTITFYSVDVTGNTEKSQTLQVKLDKAAPTTTADAPTNWSNADVTVNFTATDAQSGVANTYYSVNGSDFAAGTSVTLSNEGTNVVSFYSVDNAGNAEKSQTVTVKLDKSAPTTTSDAATAWSNQDVTVHLTASDAQSGVAKTYYSINGGPSVEGTSFTLTKEGENTVTFYSVDQLGNAEKSQTITVKLDKTAPVTAASNVPTDWTQDDVTVNFTATDAASGVANTYYSINGAPYVAGNSVTVTQDGTITVSYYTVDTAGNQEAPKSLQVKIDHTPPTVTFNLNDEYAIGSFINLRNIVTFNDLQSNIVSKKVNIDGPFGIRTFEIHDNLFVLLPGEYKVTVTATDASGQSIHATKSFTAYIPVTVEVTPSVIKGNKGEFTVRTGLPSGFLTQGFDLNTITLNGVKALTSNNGYYQQAKNGQFKFERSNFDWSPGTQTLELRGYNNGFLIVGKTTVKVQK